MNKTCTIDDLSAIWRRLFNRPSIGINNNFFELGGTAELATQLFQAIRQLGGPELPSVMVCQAPTISTLAALIGDSAQTKYCPPLLPIRRGTNPAIFMAHGMGGDAMQMLPIAQRLKLSSAIYATQAPGIDGTSDPLDSIEKMAAVYLPAMRAIQPYGPYILIGYSFGGLVMMEIAHRLQAQGEAIALLAMLDTYPHRIHLRPMQHLPLFMRSVRRRLFSIGGSLLGRSNQHVSQSPVDRAQERIRSAESVAWRSYRPRFYSGRIHFLRGAVPTYYPKKVRAVWGPLTQEFELYDIPGDHTALVTTHHKLVADILTQQLRQILDCKCVA